MPIVPVFGGGSSTPQPQVPIWLDLPTQVVRLGASATGTITLPTPSNGVGPYFFRALNTAAQTATQTLTVTGNILEISNPPGTSPAGAGASGMGWRILVWDSAGNFGTGALIVWNDVAPGNSVVVLEEKLLDPDELPNGYTFVGPRNPPAGWVIGQARAPAGDGFSYPMPITTSDIAGPRYANCPPGGFIAVMYLTVGPASASQLNLLVLRRRLDLTSLAAGFKPTLDFLDWNALSAWNPSTPLGTSATFALVTEAIPASGKSYAAERAAYTAVAGLAPTTEVATFSGGVAVLETQNTAASTRVAVMSLRPGRLDSSTQAFREGTIGPSIGALVRMKVRVTLTGNAASADVRMGRDFSPSSGSGIRIAGTTTTVGGAAGVLIYATRGGSLINSGTFRKSVWGAGEAFGLDFAYFGGQNYICAYPWDPTWTDYPEWDENSLSVPVGGAIGPLPIGDRPSSMVANTSYAWGSSMPVDTTGGDLNTFSRNWGIHIGVTQGNAVNGGARIQVENVLYFWKNLMLGVAR